MENLFNIYTQTFGSDNDSDISGIDTPVVYENNQLPQKIEQKKTIKGIDLLSTYNGYEVFLPVSFYLNQELFITIPCATIRLSSTKNIIRTAVSERQGTVKELFNIGDYLLTIKGVLIGKNDLFPDEQIQQLKELYETIDPVELHCAFTEIFQSGSRRIAIESIEFPEVQGGAKHLRPFVINCETDFIETLIYV